MKRIISLFFILLTVFGSGVTSFAEELPDEQPSQPIEAVELSQCDVILSKTEFTYNGSERKPNATVKFGETNFVKDTDYTVSYSNNINAGTAGVTVTAVEGSTVLKGETVKKFKINKKDISTVKNRTLSQTEFTYNAKQFKPTVKFDDSNYKPVLNTDYTVSYKNNVNVGKATVTVKGKGNYSGKFEKAFYIYPKNITSLKVTKLADKTFTLSWSKAKGNVDGYYIYRYNAKKKAYEYAVSTKNNYFNVGGRKPATTYTYLVKAYKKVSGKTLLSNGGSTKTVTMKPSQVVISNSAFTGKKFKFHWEKVSGNGYEIIYSKDKTFKKNVKRITVNNSNTTVKKVKMKKTAKYYFRVRAFVNVNGKKLYGQWSARKTTQYNNVYSSFSTYFNSPAGRTTNIKQACKYIDGTLLSPGAVFSFNEVVGQRTEKRGFAKATIYRGQEVAEGFGGGICQVSTTLFNAALLGNLTIVERSQHSMKVHYVDAGRDAAISWGTQDFKFKNNTEETIKISAKVINSSKIEIKLLTNSAVKPKKVTLSVSNSGKNYTLTRKVGKKVNYTTRSYY